MEHPARVRFALSLLLSLALSACSGGGGGPSSVPTPVPTTPPRISPTTPPISPTTPPTGTVNEAAFTCPTSDTAAATAHGRGASAARKAPARRQRRTQAVAGLIAVTYSRQAISASHATLSAREESLGTRLLSEYDFKQVGVTTRILKVAASQVSTVEAALRAQVGVRSVNPVEQRFTSTVINPYYPNDPYVNGFTATQTGSASTATYHVPRFLENQTVPGQWGLHAVELENAFGYSVPGNAGTVAVNAGALGSSNVKIASIDTGQDTTHPELASKVAYQKCFITNNSQSTSNFTTDPNGHGTNVAGIAAAATNNNLGFTGAGGNSVIYGYRIFPTPDDNCISGSTSDPQCSASTVDIAAAISDAIANKVNVISLSLGGGSCTNGVDSDPTEGNAIAEALANNIIVVAAAGNSTGPPLDAPACDNGVIAVGATSLADGLPNGTGGSSGSPSSPTEYVASYSSYGSPGTAFRSPSAWGIVAPGGDPNGNTDQDPLHWLDDIWTSQPFDTNFAGYCGPDYGATSNLTADCRVEIAGTSMATPVVAGAAALILAVSSAYQSPTAMKALLCETADDLGPNANEGCGRLNVYRAMATALNDPNKP
jgi:subtilisin family serine protease